MVEYGLFIENRLLWEGGDVYRPTVNLYRLPCAASPHVVIVITVVTSTEQISIILLHVTAKYSSE